MIECNHNCLECPYPDVPDECIEAALTWDEWQELDVIDKDSAEHIYTDFLFRFNTTDSE